MRSGRSGRATVRPMPLRSAEASCCSTADSIVPRTSSGRRSRSTRPESSFESSSRFWASQSSRSSWTAEESRNSARAAGSSPAGPWSSSTKVRMAAIGVRSSWLTSARKSRLRSRSRRMMSTLSSSRSAIWLNWRGQRPQLQGPRRELVGGDTREVRSPSARRREASVSRVIGRREAVGEERGHEDGDHERGRGHDQQQPGDGGEGVARLVYGFDSSTTDAPVRGGVRPPGRGRAGLIAGSRACAALRGHVASRRRRSGRGPGTGTIIAVRLERAGPNWTSHRGLGDLVGDELEQAALDQQVLDVGVERRARRWPGPPRRPPAGRRGCRRSPGRGSPPSRPRAPGGGPPPAGGSSRPGG